MRRDSIQRLEEAAAYFGMVRAAKMFEFGNIRDRGHSTKEGSSVKTIKKRRKKNKNKKTHRR